MEEASTYTYGIICLIPVIVILTTAIITKKTFESILYGAVVGFAILGFGNPETASEPFLTRAYNVFDGFLSSLYTTLSDENTIWVLLICGLFGSLIALMEKSGGVLGFSSLTEKGIKSRKSSMISAWILGIIVFVDDYLNALAVGSAMRKITDHFKVSREMLCYIINSTGVTVCAIVPFSTWTAFMSGQMKSSGMAEGMSATGAYIHTIPFILYGWAAVIVVPLFLLKVIPLFGPMKKAELRALETGEVRSEESRNTLPESTEEYSIPKGNFAALNFLLPMILVAVITIWTEDILLGLFAALLLCLVIYLPQRLMKVGDYFDALVKGFTEMFPVLIIIVLAYVFQDASSQLGLTDFVIDVTLQAISPAFLPVTIFLVIAMISFATGTFWGLAAIAFPIIAPLAEATGSNPFMCAGALISAVALGGHICLYSDTVILSCASTQITNVDYFRTSAPLVAVPAVIAVIAFLIMGFVMA